MRADISPETSGWVASGNVVTTDLGDGLALLDLRTNQYFSLNDVGAFVWQELQTPKRRDEIVHAVTAQYEISAAECASDIDVLLQEFRDAALVEQRDAAA
jgi:hypothetical protein